MLLSKVEIAAAIVHGVKDGIDFSRNNRSLKSPPNGWRQELILAIGEEQLESLSQCETNSERWSDWLEIYECACITGSKIVRNAVEDK